MKINLFQGIPEQAEVPPVARVPSSGQAVNPPAQAPQPAVPASGPNANPLDLFPQVDNFLSLAYELYYNCVVMDFKSS